MPASSGRLIPLRPIAFIVAALRTVTPQPTSKLPGVVPRRTKLVPRKVTATRHTFMPQGGCPPAGGRGAAALQLSTSNPVRPACPGERDCGTEAGNTFPPLGVVLSEVTSSAKAALLGQGTADALHSGQRGCRQPGLDERPAVPLRSGTGQVLPRSVRRDPRGPVRGHERGGRLVARIALAFFGSYVLGQVSAPRR